MSLKAHEYQLRKIFSSDFDFTIPHYQRPYAWETEQALQLLDDLEDALERDLQDPYFLGSLVLVKPEDSDPAADVIDGQQRLTTLSILFSVLRDLSTDAETAKVLADMVLEPGVALDGILPKPRLKLRHQDAAFFEKYVQTPGKLQELMALTDQALGTDSQRALRDNTKALWERLASWTDPRRNELASLARVRTMLVAVSTPNITSAHRIFSVMNARGLDLTPADVFKAQVVGKIKAEQQETYAKVWEDAEQDLGRTDFADLFLHLRMIVSKVRGQRELLIEFPQQVLQGYLKADRAADFIDQLLLPYSQAYGHLLSQDYDESHPQWRRVNGWLKRLTQLDNNDWRPAALWALRNHADDPVFLDEFLSKLERLAASMLIRRSYTTPRVTRYAELLKQLDDQALGLDAPAFELMPEEMSVTLARLDDELYLVRPVRKYVLLRLDELLANQPGVTYDHKIISVEHVLPQNPSDNSEWVQNFTKEERDRWTHRLGNLLLLNRARNSAAQNYDFQTKKAKYFTTSSGSAAFALTTQVLTHDEWTPMVIEARQQSLTTMLAKAWRLN
ncbi:hypothetical protein N865_02850 [Intrasporangium oryzae NRRL B-24470]|uniref:DUF262 domain-containing protein n=1 Tax=Intrasporangium oryzae NRRL B-24470 TaxID=1386089 RepID=W9G8V9_9MICO|nr:DUF262 domain-containing protein [Intrasporangium oryzae]EWT02611.1 hypothetical protein N865_02850 [Intrasporangium oryzae NRRL B-24470]